MPEKLHLVYATDKGFLMPTMVSAASAIAHASEPERLVIDILDCGFDDADWLVLTENLLKIGLVEVRRYKVDMSLFADIPAYRGNRGNYARFMIPELLLEEKWCVYADGDTLFLGDVFELLEFYDETIALYGHKDLCDNVERQKVFSELGFRGDITCECICSGFLLMNLLWFRQRKMLVKMVEWLRASGRDDIYDQDALNILCEGHIRLLPPEWGVFNVESFENGLIPKCVHYAYGKPWRLDADWTRCLLDVDRLWFMAAKKYCGISIADCVPVSHYFRRWIRSLVHKFFLLFVCTTEYGRKRWGKQRCYYSSKSIKKSLMTF